MVGINFRKKGLNQKLFSKKEFRASVAGKSSAFKTLMKNEKFAHVVNKASKRRVLYQAIKERAAQAGLRGFTKKDMKKVLGDVEHSFSHKKIHELGEELIGGAANSRIIREEKHITENHEEKFSSAENRTVHIKEHANIENHHPQREKRLSHRKEIIMHKTIKEIIGKDNTQRLSKVPLETKEKQQAVENKKNSILNERAPVRNGALASQEISKRPTFDQSDKALRKVQEENIIINLADFRKDEDNEKEDEDVLKQAEKDSQQETFRKADNFGYIPKYLKNFYRDKNSDKIKARLAGIQENAKDEEEQDQEGWRLAA
jgi:hypothetical protein